MFEGITLVRMSHTATEHCDALVQWARGSLVPAATTDDAAGKKRTSNRAASSKKRKGTDAVASTSTIESVHPYLSLVCSTAVEVCRAPQRRTNTNLSHRIYVYSSFAVQCALGRHV